MATENNIFYVYILFDSAGIPRYVGKGKGRRWSDLSSHGNPFRASFLRQTMETLGEIPKIKVQEDLSEAEALNLEISLIAALGRLHLHNGPLTNLTAGGDGIDSESAKAIFHGLTADQKQKAISRITTQSSEQRRNAGLASLKRRGKSGQVTMSRAGGNARAAKYDRAEWGAIISKAALTKLTPEQRSERGRKNGAQTVVKTTPEQRKEISLKAYAARNVAYPPDAHSKKMTAHHASLTPEQRKARIAQAQAARWPRREDDGPNTK